MSKKQPKKKAIPKKEPYKEFNFKPGNDFWNLRSEHGRKRLFETPQLMWEAATKYFQWCEENPLIEIDFKGKDADRVQIPKMRPFTLHGVCHYMDCNTGYFNDFMSSIKGKKDRLSLDFSLVITRIKEMIYNQKYTGAASGFLNPNIIARDLGLADNTKNTNEVTVSIEKNPLTKDKAKNIVSKFTKDI